MAQPAPGRAPAVSGYPEPSTGRGRGMTKHVVIVAPDGAASVTPVARYLAARREREAEEAARIAEVKSRGHVPEQCGPEIPEAPARGAFRVFEPQPGTDRDGAALPRPRRAACRCRHQRIVSRNPEFRSGSGCRRLHGPGTAGQG